MTTDEKYMKKALKLALSGWGTTNPNPLVGAVIVKNGRIVAQGYHEKAGGPHAEIAAFSSAKDDVAGGTLYVNLEPCSHLGRTPPCVEAIIEKKIKKVVVAMTDPNPMVEGRGIARLREAAIEVVPGVLEQEAKRLNEIFIGYITRKKPFVIMKAAMTLDGKIASATGDSKWISGASSREAVHKLRERVAAVMTGSRTVLADDPLLTARFRDRRGIDPIRIVVDSRGIIPEEKNVFNTGTGALVILATTSAIRPEKERRLLDQGVIVIKQDGADGFVDLTALMRVLYNRQIDSILLEGGGGLNAAALKAGIVDKVMMFIAPKIIGGKDAVTPVEGEGISFMKDAADLGDIRVSRFGEDVLIEGYVKGESCLPVL